MLCRKRPTVKQASNHRNPHNRKYVVPPHPNNVKPFGNALFDTGVVDCKVDGLGTLRRLGDEFLVGMLRELSAADMCRLSLVSKALYVFGQTEEVWRFITIEEFDGDFQFDGTWKQTYVKRAYNKQLQQTPLKVSGFYSDFIYNKWYCSNIDLWVWGKVDNIERVSAKDLTVEEFNKRFGAPLKPVIITDLVPTWPAFTKWTPSKLTEMYGDVVFRTDAGVEFKLRDYFAYCGVKEYNPMYLFDNHFGEKALGTLDDYQVPEYFQKDFFSLLGPEDRPSFRWILIGPPRTGSAFHKDPNATSAWNGLISGAKKWIMYPPNVVPPGVFPSEDGWEVVTPESIVEWMTDFYSPADKNAALPIECIQKPGELIFIPSSWWHAALNLEESIAVTQNFVNENNLGNVVEFLRSKKSQELWCAFEKEMQQHHPNLINTTTQQQTTAKPKKLGMWQQLMQPSADQTNSTFSILKGLQ